MTILNDVHGTGKKNPNGRAHKTPHYARAVQHFEAFSRKKHGKKRHGEQESFITPTEFNEFSKSTPSLLWPAFRLQSDVRSVAGLLRAIDDCATPCAHPLFSCVT